MFEMLICCGGKEWKRLYLELIRPHLEYFVLLWGSWTRKMLTDLSKLSKGPSGWSGRWGRVPQKPRKELLRCHQPPSLHGRRRKDINLIGAHSHWTQKNIFKWRQSSLGTLPGRPCSPCPCRRRRNAGRKPSVTVCGKTTSQIHSIVGRDSQGSSN